MPSFSIFKDPLLSLAASTLIDSFVPRVKEAFVLVPPIVRVTIRAWTVPARQRKASNKASLHFNVFMGREWNYHAQESRYARKLTARNQGVF